MYSGPPLRRTRARLWLPPNVWLHGSQSTITGGVRARNGQHAARLSWFAVSMRWVLTTPLGVAVEPEVNRILARVSGGSGANARARAAAWAGELGARARAATSRSGWTWLPAAAATSATAA